MQRRRFLRHATTAAMSVPLLARAAARDSFEFGVASDAQYADIEPKGTRYYRMGRERLGAAVEHFNLRGAVFAVHLGDLIERDWASFDAMAVPLARSRLRWHQVLGNHDFDVPDGRKAQVPEKLGMPARYRDFEYGGFRFVILDTNDVSTYAYAAGTPERAEAERELARLQAANVRQAKPWNGGIGAKQLAWFEGICRDAAARGEKVIVLAHHPVYPDNEHNVWNADTVLAAVDRQPNVVAWLNGHNHKGGYGVRNGVGYLTLHGMVETADTNAFATVRVYPDRLVVTGHGREPERELRLRTG